jgi:hypothetical protein
MGISAEMIVGVVVLTLLGLLLTGPGMWSERWGWKWLRGFRGRRASPHAKRSGEAKPPDRR